MVRVCVCVQRKEREEAPFSLVFSSYHWKRASAAERTTIHLSAVINHTRERGKNQERCALPRVLPPRCKLPSSLVILDIALKMFKRSGDKNKGEFMRGRFFPLVCHSPLLAFVFICRGRLDWWWFVPSHKNEFSLSGRAATCQKYLQCTFRVLCMVCSFRRNILKIESNFR